MESKERRHRLGKVVNDPRKEGRTQCKDEGGGKRNAEDELQEEVKARRMRSTGGGEELPICEASSPCGWRSQHVLVPWREAKTQL